MTDMNDRNKPGRDKLLILEERIRRNDSRVEAFSRILESAVESISAKMAALENAEPRDTAADGRGEAALAMLSARIEDITDSITTLSADIQGIRRNLTETSGSVLQLHDDFEGYKFASKLVEEDTKGGAMAAGESASADREAITDIAAAVAALSDRLDENNATISSLRSDNRQSVETLAKRLESFESTNRSNTLSIGQAVEALVNRIEQVEQHNVQQHETFDGFSPDNVAPYIADVEREIAETAPKADSDHLFDRIASASADAYSEERTLRPREADEAPLSHPGEDARGYEEEELGHSPYGEEHESGGQDGRSPPGMEPAESSDPSADVPDVVEDFGGLDTVEGEHRRTKRQAAGEFEQEFDAEDYEEKPRSVADIRSKMRTDPQPTGRKSRKAAAVKQEDEDSGAGLLGKITSVFSSKKDRREADDYDLPEEEFEAEFASDDFASDDDEPDHPNANISSKDSRRSSGRRSHKKRSKATEADSFADEYDDDWDEEYASGGSNKRFMLLGAAVLVAGVVLGLTLFGIK